MTGSDRVHFGDMLRRARDERMLSVSAAMTRAASRRRAPAVLAGPDAAALVSIVAALDRLSATPSLFGRCEICGCDVPRAALDLEPWTTRCPSHSEEMLWFPPNCSSALPA